MLIINCSRDNALLSSEACPTDVLAIEQTGSYHGQYFVLMGYLYLSQQSIDGIGPEELGITQLTKNLIEHPPKAQRSYFSNEFNC